MANIVVTGSTRGIGLGLVKAFRARGHHIMISSRGATAVEAAIAEVIAAPGFGEVIGRACDVSDRDQVQALWNAAFAKWGRVDIWINNAGVSGPKRTLPQLTRADIDPVIATNIWGMIWGTQVPLAGMTAQGGGKIFNFEGFGSDGMTAPGLTIYGFTKRALTYFTKSVNKEIKGSPVMLGTISPGIVITDLLDASMDEDPEAVAKTRRIYNILADRVETVAPWIADQALAVNRTGAAIKWLTTGKAARRFVGNLVKKRDVFNRS